MVFGRVRALAAVLTFAAIGCSSSTHRSTPPTSSTVAVRPGPLVVPLTYQAACANEPAVCEPGAKGSVPDRLKRPLHLPVIRPGEHCPASPGAPTNSSYFVGVALGHGPVRPIPAARGDLDRGVVDLSTNTGVPGWLGFKTLWFSIPSYLGPWVVRAKRLDGSGPIAFGETPTLKPLVVPPGATLNSQSGYRTVPGGTWVKGPGCYGWQVDGLTFSDVIVVETVLRPQTG